MLRGVVDLILGGIPFGDSIRRMADADPDDFPEIEAALDVYADTIAMGADPPEAPENIRETLEDVLSFQRKLKDTNMIRGGCSVFMDESLYRTAHREEACPTDMMEIGFRVCIGE